MMKWFLKMKHGVSLALVLLLALALWPTAALAAAENIGSITFTYEVAGAEFELHHVGYYDGWEFSMTDAFAGYSVDLQDPLAAYTLMLYVQRDNLEPIRQGVTDENCQLRFEGLPAGVFLLFGSPTEVDNKVYTPSPCLILIPVTDETGEIRWDIEPLIKFEVEDQPSVTELTVLKLWKDVEGEDHPQSVTVELLRDGEVVETVTLDAGNNWMYTWKDLEEDHVWSVVEKEVPEGYTVTISKNGTAYIIENTKQTPEPTPTPPPSTEPTPTPVPTTPPPTPGLPQTGQLWWPVSLLAGSGVLFLMIGLLRRRYGENHEK